MKNNFSFVNLNQTLENWRTIFLFRLNVVFMSNCSVEKEKVDKLDDFKKLSFERVKKDSFQKEVKSRVDQFFKDNKISPFADTEMVVKTILILLGWSVSYVLLLLNLISPLAMLALCGVHGFFTALIGLNVAHDAIHGAFSKSSKMNRFVGSFFNLIGANDYVWSVIHNIVHHTYTNIPDHDEDINQPFILRMEPTQKLRSMHKYQYIYAYFVYSLASLSWVFIKDYRKFFQHKTGGHVRKSLPRYEMIRMFVYKAIYYAMFVVLPYFVIDLPWHYIFFGFLFSHLVEGFSIAVIFVLAHVVEGTTYPTPNEQGKIEMTWAELQMYTTSNFAIKNRVVNYLFGGLNFQIEHHLFPRISHVHYPKITEIVRKTALEYNLPYLVQDTFFGAVASHTRVLKSLGKK